MTSDNFKAVGLVTVLLGVGACAACEHLDRDTYKVHVTDKQVKRGSGKNAQDKYLVFTKLPDGQTRVFEDTDSLLEFKWNSSDVWAQIETGKDYEFKTYGYRVPFLSAYENIIGVTALPDTSR